MAAYQFIAKSLNGRQIRGEVEAESEQDARVKLRAQKLVPIKVKARGKSLKLSKGNGKVKPKELQIFTRQFAVLISSGVPIMQSIDSMAQGAKSPAMVSTLQDISESLNKGKRLAEAMANHPQVFDRMYVNLVKAGEEGGVLEEILSRLADHIEKSVKIKGKIKGAMAYPAAIILVAFIVITAIMVFVIPSFQEMFEQNGQELPALTTFVIDLSDKFQKYWYLIIGAAVGFGYGLKVYYGTKNGKETIDKYLIATPILGAVIQKGSIAVFSRTLSTLLKAGVRVVECLDIASSTVSNSVIEKALLKSKDSITKGRTIVEPLRKEKYIPQMVVQMMSIGEQTGNLDTMLSKIADFFEDEVETAADALTSMMEPLLMVVLGGIIAVLVIAMYLPIFDMAGAVGG
ncbi:MAG: type II secretion system F family protein [Bdellovibrionales bacterium]